MSIVGNLPLFFVRHIYRLKTKNPIPAEDAPYRGFDPDEHLFLNNDGEPFKMRCTRSTKKLYYNSQQLVDTFRRILGRSNIPGISAQTLRNTVALWLNRRGADEGQIGTLLGISNRQNVRKLLPAPPSLADLMTDLYPDTSEQSFVSREVEPSGT